MGNVDKIKTCLTGNIVKNTPITTLEGFEFDSPKWKVEQQTI